MVMRLSLEIEHDQAEEEWSSLPIIWVLNEMLLGCGCPRFHLFSSINHPWRNSMSKVVAAIAVSAILIAFQPAISTAYAAEAAPEYLNPNPRAPLSEAVRYGGVIYLAGKTGGQGEPGIQPETRRVLESIKGALENFGSSMDKVLKCTVFLADMADWAAMNEIYTEYFPVNKPARTAVGVSFGGATLVEIECIAAE